MSDGLNRLRVCLTRSPSFLSIRMLFRSQLICERYSALSGSALVPTMSEKSERASQLKLCADGGSNISPSLAVTGVVVSHIGYSNVRWSIFASVSEKLEGSWGMYV
jgi:hypothetical protein